MYELEMQFILKIFFYRPLNFVKNIYGMNLFESLQSFLLNITDFKILCFVGNHQFHGKKY